MDTDRYKIESVLWQFFLGAKSYLREPIPTKRIILKIVGQDEHWGWIGAAHTKFLWRAGPGAEVGMLNRMLAIGVG